MGSPHSGPPAGYGRRVWALALAAWLAGAAMLAALWHWHPRSRTLDVLLGAVLYVAAFFYMLALWPLVRWAERIIARRSR